MIRKIKQLLTKKVKYVDYNTYYEKARFIGLFNFQQSVRDQNIRGIKNG